MRALVLMSCLSAVACVAPEPSEQDPPAERDEADAPLAVGEVSELWASEAVTCAHPEEVLELGMFERQILGRDEASMIQYWGAGVAVSDLDGDGDLDLFLPGEFETRILLQHEGRFEPAPERLPLGLDLSMGSGAAAADVEGDGDFDVYVSRYGEPDVLLINRGGGWFYDGSEAWGLSREPLHGQSAAFGDPDLDGDLDLFVSNYGLVDTTGTSILDYPPGDSNHLYENVGGRFEDRSEALEGPARTGYTFTGGWFDLDDDGAWELYVANDFGQTQGSNVLLDFDDWTLTPRPEAGLDLQTHAMGLSTADINMDGRYEVLVSAWERLFLMDSRRRFWLNGTEARGVKAIIDPDTRMVAWGNAMADFDADGRVDIAVVFGHVQTDGRFPNPETQLDAMLWQLPNGTFSDLSALVGGAEATSGRSLVTADLDGDGFLDLVKPSIDGDDVLLRSRCQTGAWLDLRFQQPGANPSAIGTRVRVFDGGESWMGTVRAGGDGLGSSAPPVVHVGLGDRDVVDSVEVRWPDGAVESFTDVPTRRHLRLLRRP